MVRAMSELTIAAILAPGYAEGLAASTLPDIRSRRDAANEVETGLSYLRRLVQGRLDIVLAELHRRELGEPPAGLSALVDQLPEILSEHVHAPGLGRLSSIMAPGDVDAAIQARIEDIATTETMTHLPTLDDDGVTAIAQGLRDVERDISAQRRALHEVLDRLQEEIVRRYKSGEATVDNLLS